MGFFGLNILQINSVCGVGSTGRIATDIHATLLSHGHCSTIAYGRDVAKSCEQAIRIGRKVDSYMHVARTRLLDSHGFGSKAATKQLIARIKTLNPDVIHLHNVHGYYLHVGLLFDYLKASKKPVIWTFHDCWAFTGHCTYFDYVACNRWINQCHDCPLKTEYPKSLFLDRSRQNYQQKKVLFPGVENLTIVTPSKWLAALVKKSFLKDYPVKIINNGIDLNIFRPCHSNFRERFNLEDKFVILGVASPWSTRKGYQCFLDLSKVIKADEKIVLVGLDETTIRNLPDGIIGIAKTKSTAELAEAYSAADIFINPTLEDNFPTTNLEALACGTPLITFNTGGSPEAVDKDSGLIVERGDLPGLVESIAAVRKVGKPFYSDKCRTRAEKHYDKNQRFGDYLNLYKQRLS